MRPRTPRRRTRAGCPAAPASPPMSRRARGRPQLRAPRASLQQAREAPVLENPPAGLARRAVAHDVVLVEHGLERRAAARTGPALVAVNAKRDRHLVRDRKVDGLLVVLDGTTELVADRLLQRRTLLVGEVVGALERRQAGLVEYLV